MIHQYFIINCDLAISRYDFVNKTAAAVGFRIIRFLPYMECGISVVVTSPKLTLMATLIGGGAPPLTSHCFGTV